MYRAAYDVIYRDLAMLGYVLAERDEEHVLHRIREESDVCFACYLCVIATAWSYGDGAAGGIATVLIAHSEANSICAILLISVVWVSDIAFQATITVVPAPRLGSEER